MARALTLQKKGYALVRYMAGLSDIGAVSRRGTHDAFSDAQVARLWLDEARPMIPDDYLPNDDADLDAFANLVASYLLTSFELEKPRENQRSVDGAWCCFMCVRIEQMSGLRPRKLRRSDKKRADMLQEDYLEDLATEIGRVMTPEAVEHVASDASLREPLAMVTYGRELLKRLEGHVEGPAVLALWRRFAWLRTGSPRKGFQLTVEVMLDAQERVMAAVRAADGGPES